MVSGSAAEPLALTRHALYEFVWATPIQVLSTQYDISGAGLAKICRRYDIPVPPRGYWQKRAAGLPTTRSRLPVQPGVAQDAIVATFAPRGTPRESVAAAYIGIRAQRAYEDDPTHRIMVTTPLSAIAHLHPLVRRTERALRKAKYRDRGLLRVHSEPILNVSVTPEQVDRAMCIMDALIKGLEARGFPVESRAPRPVHTPGGSTPQADPRPRPYTCVRVEEQDVLLELREHRTQVDRKKLIESAQGAREYLAHDPYPRYDYVGSGRLVLIIPHHVGNWGALSTWTEGPRLRLDDVLGEVVLGVVAAAQDFRETLAHWADESRQREEEARRARLEQQRRALQAARVQHLEQRAANWTKAQQIRAFLAVVRVAAPAVAVRMVPEGMSREEWIAWAEEYVESLDPL